MPSDQVRWIVVSSACGDLLSIQQLPPGTDLYRALLNTLDELRGGGWLIENEPTYPCVFANRGAERRMVMVSYIDPAGAPLRHFSPWRDEP